MDGEDTGSGFSINVNMIPEGINWTVNAMDTPYPRYLKKTTCKTITLSLNPQTPGEYNLSMVNISVKSNAGTVSTRLGKVKIDVTKGAFRNLTTVYYPYAGVIFERKHKSGL